jgi:hypothetical protein
MTDQSNRPSGLRQWRITITEMATPGKHLIQFSWRGFPCKATEWQGSLFNQVVDDLPRITSAEDVASVIAAAVDGKWWESVRASYRPPGRY